ncbi:MAG: O-linked N-acetylglucosamine transferase, SPINDLY family protein, partial [Gallionella sp.]
DAIRLAPNPARAHLNLGNVLLLKGDLEGALQAFRTAIQHKPDHAGAYYNIGNALLGNGQFDEAAANYRSALEIQPDYAEVHCSLGVALKELGQPDDAIASFQRALKLNPDLVEAQSNLGNILEHLYNSGNVLLNNGKLEKAVANFRRVLEIEPNLTEAHDSLGRALQELGQLDNAVASYHRALELKPDYAEAHNNLGTALEKIGQLDNALASYQRALALKPDYVEVHTGLGNVLQELGQFAEAAASYRRALEIRPDYLNALHNLLFTLIHTANHTPSYHLDQARQFGRIVAEKVTARFASWQCAAQPERLRVGLVSGDLFTHSVGHFLEGLLTRIDPARIELIAYPTHRRQDELTARIRPRFSEWKPLTNLSDETAARLIHADGVHVLVDLSGHTEHNRLPVFAWKPAPVQVTWLGLPATTGVAEMDYVLGDPHAIPAEHENHFSETVWRMPDSYVCLTVPTSPVNVAPLPGLSTGYVTFGSFNNLTKMNDAVVAVWARILKLVPNSRLLLKTKQLSEASVCEKTRQRFAACGIAPDRLLLGGMLASRDDHLAAYNKIDIALDTFPYPGVTTSVEALWMGVPVLNMQGDRFLSCTAGSIAHNAGLSDWIAADADDYVAKAAAFASDLERLAALRSGLRRQVLASPLFDAPRFAWNFENALWEMWQRHQAKPEKPA